MALGNNGAGSNLETVVLKLKSKGDAFFQVKRKEDGKFIDTDTTTSVTGRFMGLFVKKWEYEWEEILSYSLNLADEQAWEKYVLDISMTSLGRALANSLLSLEDFSWKDMNISLYKKGEYNNIALRVDDELIKWSMSMDEQKELIDSTTSKKGKVTNDYTDLNNKLYGLLEARASKGNTEDTPANTEVNSDIDIDSIPF